MSIVVPIPSEPTDPLSKQEKLLRRIAYMGTRGRPAAHHFNPDDEVVEKWREDRRKLIERLRKELEA